MLIKHSTLTAIGLRFIAACTTTQTEYGPQPRLPDPVSPAQGIICVTASQSEDAPFRVELVVMEIVEC